MASIDTELADFLVSYGKSDNMPQVADQAAKRFGLSRDEIFLRIESLEAQDLIRPRADPARNVAEGEPRHGATRGWWERGDGTYGALSNDSTE